MDGFVAAGRAAQRGCAPNQRPGVRERHARPTSWATTTREIPNYWTYAKNFVLHDHMFEPIASWSLPATCTWSRSGRRSARHGDPSSCRNDNAGPYAPPSSTSFNRANATGSAPLLRVDRHHLPARPRTTSAGATTSTTGSEPDCAVATAASCPREAAELHDAGHLESAAAVHRRPATTTSSRNVRPSTSSSRPPSRDSAGGVVGHARPDQLRASAGQHPSPARPGSTR